VGTAGTDGEIRLAIGADADIVAARQQGRRLALVIGFSPGDATVVSAAISEIARNILEYAGRGEIRIGAVESRGRHGIEVVGTDAGPGIPDVGLAMQDGYSTSGSLGLGLPGARRLMDDFDVRSEVQRGTTVTMRKWRR
jgi:serine/threonine-protein kinase RsbT